jgi:DNA-binding MarR family transcriptional regulator
MAEPLPDPPLSLFFFLWRAAHDAARLVEPARRKFGEPTTSQLMALYAIDREAMACTIATAAEIVGCTPQNMTMMSKTLERKGWIASSEYAPDRRIRNLEITDRGRAKLDAAHARVLPALAQVFGALPKEQHAYLSSSLRKISTMCFRQNRPTRYLDLPAQPKRDPDAENLRLDLAQWRKHAEAWGWSLAMMRSWGYPIPEGIDQ